MMVSILQRRSAPLSSVLMRTVVCIMCFQVSSSSKILILPGVPVGSHYLFMAKIGKLLTERGHNITMVTNEGFNALHGKRLEQDKSVFSFEEYQSIFNSDFIQSYLRASRGVFDGSVDFWDIFANIKQLSVDCEMLLEDNDLFLRLDESNYDLIVANSFHLCHALVVHKLNIPFISVSTQRIIPMLDGSFHGIPSYPSYVTALMSGLMDKMTFVQRLRNFGHYLLSYFVFNHVMLKPYKSLKDTHNIRPDASLHELLGSSEMAFFCFDFAFEFPRPSMPHAVHIGGLLAGPASPLTKDWEEFIGSAENGVVVFSFGSHANIALNPGKAELFVRAFARLPQKVIMRYDGPPPPGVGDNTKLAKWIPQNDLLGHPKTKAFVAHGGMNSVYEAIYHGIPVVGVPLFADNSDNFARLVDRGMALTVDIVTLTEDQLYKAVTTVVHDKSFKENAMRLSRIHRNQPMTAGESAVYWTEYVLRHGGQHLRPASFDLNIFQYFLVDVFAFCLVVCGIVVYIAAKICKLCCHVCRRKEKIQ
ncbi:UDP-glucuronosyltransferase 2B15-like [Ptychodera flava]|uniref:UDP-glucuronosyltransferase 2B15-like n=1 Tax=Ptychodera flava TaxID=63121 RepID=UPI00396A61CD